MNRDNLTYLTEHFTLIELTRSTTAATYYVDNTPMEGHVDNLRALCSEVLEPLRQHAGMPVLVSSGYRCRTLNKLVGGVPNSQHTTGEAADIAAPTHDANGRMLSSKQSLEMLREWMSWMEDNLAFDQLILEHKRKGRSTTHWLHVSYSRTHNRQCVIDDLWKRS